MPRYTLKRRSRSCNAQSSINVVPEERDIELELFTEPATVEGRLEFALRHDLHLWNPCDKGLQ